MQKAIQFLSRKEYSQKQLKDKLALYDYSPEDIEKTLYILQQKNLQSDARFAEFIACKHQYKGENKLQYELKQHELSTEDHMLAINTLNTNGDEYKRIKMAWHKKFCRSYSKSFSNLDVYDEYSDDSYDSKISRYKSQQKIEQKYIRFLLSQGFNYDVIRKFLYALQRNEEIFDSAI